MTRKNHVEKGDEAEGRWPQTFCCIVGPWHGLWTFARINSFILLQAAITTIRLPLNWS